MKVSIKLITSEVPTSLGYPIYVFLSDGQKRFKRCVGHSAKEDWNDIEKLPYKYHKAYHELLPTLLEFHAKMVKINYGSYTFEVAKEMLFTDLPKKSNLFYDAALLVTAGIASNKTASIYKTVINSFNGFYPGIAVSEITPKMVNAYMDFLLLKNRPNGVHAYLTKLQAVFSRITDTPNPFKGVRPRKVKTPQKQLLESDLIKLVNTRAIVSPNDFKNTSETINRYRYYWLLMFYLGGIDFIDLANMRYDQHVVNGRIQFYRHKGGTNAFVNNIIPPQALDILKNFDCKPYLVPIYQSSDLDTFRNNMNKRFAEMVADLQLTQRPLSKSARYTFINRARQLMIDERITMEIVGHEQQTVHSIYTDNFPLHIRDAAHLKIIDLPV